MANIQGFSVHLLLICASLKSPQRPALQHILTSHPAELAFLALFQAFDMSLLFIGSNDVTFGYLLTLFCLERLLIFCTFSKTENISWYILAHSLRWDAGMETLCVKRIAVTSENFDQEGLENLPKV